MREKNNPGSSFFAGFVMGVLVTLLFTTKKGRKILKTLTDEGKEALEQILEPNVDDLAGDEIPSGDGDEEEIPEKNIPARKGILRHLRKN